MNHSHMWTSQMVYCEKYPPYSLQEVTKTEEANSHVDQDPSESEEVDVVEQFNDPIPTREYP